jgi:hypothetical protein
MTNIIWPGGRALVIALLATTASLSPTQVKAASNLRFYVASQYDYEQKLGFYLDLRGASLSDLTLTLAVGDGKGWRYARHGPGLVADRDYEICAVIAPDRAQLLVDRKLVAESAGPWQPAAGPLDVNYRPPWTPPSEWLVIVRRMTVTVSGAGKEVSRQEFDFSRTASRAVPLQLFEPGDKRSAEITSAPGDTVTLEAAMRLAVVELKQWAPFIDPYGQCRYAEWPEKVRSDDDLRGDIAREDAELAKMPLSPDFDEYGGYQKAGWREEPTGFFRALRRNGYWWLISPLGNPCFYLGVSEIPAAVSPSTPITGRESLFERLPPREKPWSGAWGGGDTQSVSFHACNLIRKYGDNWVEQTTSRAVRRVRAWGFSGGGKWGAPAGLVSAPVLGRGATPVVARHPDVFDPKVCEVFRGELERQVAPRRSDPRILGWSLGNEWDEIISPGEIAEILAKSAATPAKRALVDYAVDQLYGGSAEKAAAAWKVDGALRTTLYASKPTPPDEDIEKLRCFYADRYYDFVYRAFKSIDPNHLYLGFWIMPQWGGWWPNQEDWRLISRHCDVIGYDRYTPDYESPQWRRLQAETDKPTLCGEFGFPAWYDGLRGFGRYDASWTRDDAEAGEVYYRWVEAGARDPYCVGLMFFVYRDQPLTGRGPGRGAGLVFGEHFAFGLITETDRPKWAMVQRMREANLHAAEWRVQAAGN